jgi:hypothetical protein
MQRLTLGLNERLSLEPRQAAVVQAFGQVCLKELASECAGLDPGIPVSEREVSCLLIGRDGDESGEF